MAAQWSLLLTALTLGGSALVGALRRQQRLDWLYLGAAIPFAAFAALELWAHGRGWPAAAYALPMRLLYQCLISGVALFLMALFKGALRVYRQLLGVQLWLGLALAVSPGLAGSAAGLMVAAWAWFNIGCAGVLVALLAHALWRYKVSSRGWTVFLAATAALNAMASDLLGEGSDGVLTVSWAQVFVLPTLAVPWLLMTRRLGHPGRRGTEADLHVRQQWAQDLHDGLGSQLSAILSSLGRNTPQERATAAALHECLLELKLLVDGADEAASVVQLLASLRYRLQPLLQASGIELHWHVAFAQELEQFDGARAREVLRIAQEALGNVVRHSGASQVRLCLRCMKSRQTLELEINDNGKGLASTPEGNAHHAMGKGLGGMRQRAAALGGHLSIRSAPDIGTRLSLSVPLGSAGGNRGRTQSID